MERRWKQECEDCVLIAKTADADIYQCPNAGIVFRTGEGKGNVFHIGETEVLAAFRGMSKPETKIKKLSAEELAAMRKEWDEIRSAPLPNIIIAPPTHGATKFTPLKLNDADRRFIEGIKVDVSDAIDSVIIMPAHMLEGDDDPKPELVNKG